MILFFITTIYHIPYTYSIYTYHIAYMAYVYGICILYMYNSYLEIDIAT